MCLLELAEEGKANAAAKDGKKYTRSPQHDVLDRRSQKRYASLIEQRKEQIRQARENNKKD